jgi:uncharacterized protein (TIGR00251 family)
MSTPVFRLSSGPGGTVFPVKVSPGASKEKIAGEHGGALKVSVSAPPQKEKANAALLKLLAKALKVGKKELEILSGETGRDKRVLLCNRSMEETRKLLHGIINT